MSKIMVVEDDASLREIYSVRITAEGYDVVPAGDGEEALAIAVREKPDLILSDVMMPKISGFDMLDILRSTPETASIKVVMMTALSGNDQRLRGERLGADRYLVKSQVGIEDVISTIHEVLGDKAPEPAQASAPASTAKSTVTSSPAAATIPVPVTPENPTPQANYGQPVNPTQ
ncbi:response regulator [Candidatus Saccharibacteria bacterium]|nr:response regulator [Candidatus Saccharibacteria bacterium]